MPENILLNTEEKMEKTITSLRSQLSQFRTGSATPNMLDSISVSYYGAPTPLNQVAHISVPEGNQLVVKPFDKTILKDIENAISNSELKLNPQNDGEILRIIIPKLTEETRKELVKRVGKTIEQSKVAIRNIRRDSNDSLKKLDLTEDEFKGYQDDVQKLTDKFVKIIEDIAKEKEKDLMTV